MLSIGAGAAARPRHDRSAGHAQRAGAQPAAEAGRAARGTQEVAGRVPCATPTASRRRSPAWSWWARACASSPGGCRPPTRAPRPTVYGVSFRHREIRGSAPGGGPLLRRPRREGSRPGVRDRPRPCGGICSPSGRRLGQHLKLNDLWCEVIRGWWADRPAIPGGPPSGSGRRSRRRRGGGRQHQPGDLHPRHTVPSASSSTSPGLTARRDPGAPGPGVSPRESAAVIKTCSTASTAASTTTRIVVPRRCWPRAARSQRPVQHRHGGHRQHLLLVVASAS
jgi:hypothetical protein